MMLTKTINPFGTKYPCQPTDLPNLLHKVIMPQPQEISTNDRNTCSDAHIHANSCNSQAYTDDIPQTYKVLPNTLPLTMKPQKIC